MGCSFNITSRKRIQGFEEVKQYEAKPYFFEISPNEKFLAYQLSDKIKIVNLKSQFKIKEISMRNNNNVINKVGYFQDSRVVCIISHPFQIRIYRADNYYKQINALCGQDGIIYDFQIINQHYILSSNQDSYIVVTDYLSKNKILKIKDSFKEDQLQRFIQFDSKNQVIISNSYEDINFDKMNGKNIINFNEKKIITRCNQLISQSVEDIIQQFCGRQIINKDNSLSLLEFQNHKSIYRLQLFQESLIILLDLNDMMIFDMNDFQIIHQQLHKIEHIYYDNDSKLIITSNNQLFVI